MFCTFRGNFVGQSWNRFFCIHFTCKLLGQNFKLSQTLFCLRHNKKFYFSAEQHNNLITIMCVSYCIQIRYSLPLNCFNEERVALLLGNTAKLYFEMRLKRTIVLLKKRGKTFLRRYVFRKAVNSWEGEQKALNHLTVAVIPMRTKEDKRCKEIY